MQFLMTALRQITSSILILISLMSGLAGLSLLGVLPTYSNEADQLLGLYGEKHLELIAGIEKRREIIVNLREQLADRIAKAEQVSRGSHNFFTRTIQQGTESKIRGAELELRLAESVEKSYRSERERKRRPLGIGSLLVAKLFLGLSFWISPRPRKEELPLLDDGLPTE
ncbi:hypothetical protein LBMAG52_05230 [Planctomycetia bacterium]|nr:hypothetical protein LBMAG52_05230 [Planctomycetia bacterium]